MKPRVWVVIGLLVVGAMVWAGGTVEQEEGFSYQEVTVVRVDARHFDLEVEGASGGVVEGAIFRSYPDEDVFHEMRGSEVRVWVPRRLRWGRINRGSRILLTVPDDAEVMLETSSGDIRFQSFGSSSVRVRASSGDVAGRAIQGELAVNTSSGSIELTEVEGSLTLESSSGDIQVRACRGPIRSASSSGRQEYEDIKGDLAAVASSGDLTIRGSEGGLSLKTSSGRIEADHAMITKDSQFTASSGDISVDFANSPGNFRFDLTSSSGRLEAGPTKTERRLEAGTGSTLIVGRTSSGDQSYR